MVNVANPDQEREAFRQAARERLAGGGGQAVDPARQAFRDAARARLGERKQPPTKPEGSVPARLMRGALEQGEELITAPFALANAGYQKIRSMSAADWADLARNPEQVVDALWSGTKKVISATVGPDSDYARHGLSVFIDRPLTPLIDGLTLLSLGGTGAVKLGQVGAKSAKVAGDALKLARAEKLIAAGEKVAGIPRRIGQEIFDAPLRMVGINPQTRRAEQAIRRMVNASALADRRLELDNLRKITKGMDDAAWQEFHNAAVRGADNFVSPNAKALYDYTDNFLKGKEKEIVARGIRSADDLERIKNIKFARNNGVDEAVAKATRARQKFKSLYTPAEFDGKLQFKDLVDGPEGLIENKTIGFLNAYNKGKSVGDPRKWLPQVVDSWIDARKEFRYMDQLQGEGLIKGVGAGVEALDTIIENPLIRKYASEKVSAQASAIKEMVEAATTKDALLQLSREGIDPARIDGISKLAATDRTMRNILALRYKQPIGVVGKLIHGYDRIIGTMKKGMTVFNPSFYTGNLVGDALFMTLAGTLGVRGKLARKIAKSFPAEFRAGAPSIVSELGVGGRITDSLASIVQSIDGYAARGLLTKFQAQAIKQGLVKFDRSSRSVADVIKAMNEAPGKIAELQSSAMRMTEAVARTVPEIEQIGAKIGGLDSSINQLKAIKETPKNFRQLREQIRDLEDKRGELISKRQTLQARVRLNLFKTGEIERQLPELKALREGTRRATNDALSFIGDYNGMGPIEQGVLRRIIPFYPFFKAMSQLAFKLPFIMPEKAFIWSKLARFSHSITDDPDLPDWMRGYIPAYVLENGNTVWVSINSLLPVAALRPARAFNTPIPRLFAFWQQNPLITVGLRGIGGRDEFFWAGKPKEGELTVGLADGKIARIREDGKLETVVPQQDFADAVLSTVPLVRIMEQLASPFDVNRGEKMNPDGTYRYPKETWESLLQAFGVRTNINTKEEFIRRENMFARSIFKKYRSQLRGADPETKEEIRQFMADRAQGMYRRIAAR